MFSDDCGGSGAGGGSGAVCCGAASGSYDYDDDHHPLLQMRQKVLTYRPLFYLNARKSLGRL